MKRLLLPLLFIFLALIAVVIVRFGMRLTMLREPRHAAAEFRLATVNGRPMGRRACVAGISGGRLVLGKNGRWWIREEVCAPVAGKGIWVGDDQWSGDTLILHQIGARPGHRPMGRVVRRGDTLDLANTDIGIHTYRYVRIPARR